jgi:hypothetical protein
MYDYHKQVTNERESFNAKQLAIIQIVSEESSLTIDSENRICSIVADEANIHNPDGPIYSDVEISIFSWSDCKCRMVEPNSCCLGCLAFNPVKRKIPVPLIEHLESLEIDCIACTKHGSVIFRVDSWDNEHSSLERNRTFYLEFRFDNCQWEASGIFTGEYLKSS